MAVACLFLLTSAGAAHSQLWGKYTVMDTRDSFVLMDSGGVAYRVTKRWQCRYSWWSPSAEPKLIESLQEYESFKERAEADGSWDGWTCVAVPGEVVFSRDILNAQKTLNAARQKPDGAPSIPESGHWNWEMLEYRRLEVGRDVTEARDRYKAGFAYMLSVLMEVEVPEDRLQRDPAGVIAELAPKAKAHRMVKPDPRCGPSVNNFFDFTACRLAKQDAELKIAEDVYREYKRRVDDQRGREFVPAATAGGISMDSETVEKHLQMADGAAMEP